MKMVRIILLYDLFFVCIIFLLALVTIHYVILLWLLIHISSISCHLPLFLGLLCLVSLCLALLSLGFIAIGCMLGLVWGFLGSWKMHHLLCSTIRLCIEGSCLEGFGMKWGSIYARPFVL